MMLKKKKDIMMLEKSASKNLSLLNYKSIISYLFQGSALNSLSLHLSLILIFIVMLPSRYRNNLVVLYLWPTEKHK